MSKMVAGWRHGLLCLGVLTLAGCNSGASGTTDPLTPPVSGQPTDPVQPVPGQPTNAAPEIAGSPRAQVLVGRSYDFKPSASDADGDHLSFSIASKPAWASFNSSTGRISGTPQPDDIGSYEDITVSVSDGAVVRALPSFAIAVVDEGSASGTVTLAWQPPTRNTDGSPLTNLGGYRIHYGTEPGSYDQTIRIDNAGVTSFVVENLPPGTYYFSISSVSSIGVESDPSREASNTI